MVLVAAAAAGDCVGEAARSERCGGGAGDGCCAEKAAGGAREGAEGTRRGHFIVSGGAVEGRGRARPIEGEWARGVGRELGECTLSAGAALT